MNIDSSEIPIYSMRQKIYGSVGSRSSGKSIIRVRVIRDLMEREGILSLWQNQELTNENCAYNARSVHFRCTVHPIGSCDGCKDFEHVAEDIIPNRIPPELTRSGRFDELGQVVGKSNVATMISHTLNEQINNERGTIEMDFEDLQSRMDTAHQRFADLLPYLT